MNSKTLLLAAIAAVVVVSCNGNEQRSNDKFKTFDSTSVPAVDDIKQTSLKSESMSNPSSSSGDGKHHKQVKKSPSSVRNRPKFRRGIGEINGPGCAEVKCEGNEVCVSRLSSGRQLVTCVDGKLAQLGVARRQDKTTSVDENSGHASYDSKLLEEKIQRVKAQVREFELHREKKQQKRLQWKIGGSLATAKETEHSLMSEMQNDGTHQAPSQECYQKELRAVGDRLLDHFKQQQDEHNGRKKKEKRNSTKKELHEDDECICQSPVSWQFQRLDGDADGQLTSHETNLILASGNISIEPHCVSAFVKACDHNGDNALSEKEWCCCFADVLPPCLTALKMVPSILIHGQPSVMPGAVVPQCDDDGFYKPIQCDSSSGRCWCADRNGHQLSDPTVSESPVC